MITPLPSSERHLFFPASRVDRFNAIYRGLGVDLIDWNAAITDPDDPTRTHALHERDGLHLTAEGYAVVARVTVDRILGTRI